ncbi:SAM-dependent methyltransferase [Marinicella litoralis]|uniref:Cyclopropane-fatty-acyl-phospholipid synthase n=1 Tax=Marinicella litoralis TaxID=644220 RepID=A0A4R6XRZ0_9GAMM|nr:cyclopropane-fatty-acyl-phospholipid synthase family protein [Marinicella litoralis]TDR22685.1 cyclopropane-fatty-acyl-phospholipid synthase [Marinicella litoralis]
MINTLIKWIEKGYLPDAIVRGGIRKLIRQRLVEEHAYDVEKCDQRYHEFLQEIKSSALAIDTDKANEQHYEVDADFYHYALGARKKYSSCYYHGNESLDQAEESMLALYIERGQFKDGQDILELGCGWGSITLYLAEKFPQSKITGVSNSNSQRKYIMAQAASRGLENVNIITCDINELKLNQQFDRVISIEMFEHVRNYQSLFDHIANWLKADGKMFVHIFCHRFLMYPFVAEGDDNWMGKYFFSGGQMPAVDTFYHFQERLKIERRWINSGQHYEKTSNHWLANMDENKAQIMPIFERVYGDEAKLWFQRWRIFFMSCAELFGYDEGRQWFVAHYLFSKQI